ncbi:MbnH family di-heme enzyme [Parathalassolituus penaei]|uniref:Di-heme enzyme n=1 Tax=Parathalassolituus penaei TaxID=2997323 RepID=A0A9X3IUV2_9GAMM|nr:MbnH family di-heme enzyme [Parathalassolituus penaei]MCY0967329.1 di-heme enzyme [Parathalassolituus penaei]
MALLVVLTSSLLVACMGSSSTTLDDQGASVSSFDWGLPDGIPLPVEPDDNPMTEAKFQLGRYLFYDTRLSANGDIACASCHHQEKAFTDGRQFPTGTWGDTHPRNAMSLGNTAWFATFNWARPDVTTLEEQIRGPLFNSSPIPEHGLTSSNLDGVLASIRTDSTYQALLVAAFPEAATDTEWDFDDHLIPALASFVRGLTSFDSDFDHYLQGDSSALSAAAKRGLALFASERLECTHCHLDNFTLTDNHMNRSWTYPTSNFHNTGAVYRFDEPNRGVYEVTGNSSHLGQFRTMSLRNIALTAPYSHDGSHATLEDILDTYSQGGKQGDYQVDGDLSPGFTLTSDEKADVLAFLCSLTDLTFISNPRYGNPWPDADGNPIGVASNAEADPAVNPQCQLSNP